MTFPETVSIHNIDNMKTLVQNGPDHHPGARSIIRADGKRVDLRFVKTQADQILGTQCPRFTYPRYSVSSVIEYFDPRSSISSLYSYKNTNTDAEVAARFRLYCRAPDAG
jgi:hypothetical protein